MSTQTKNLPRSASSQRGTRRAPLTSSTRKPRLSAKNRAMLALLDSPEWSNPTSAQVKEQQDTMNFLMKSLDEDRIGYRRLYPKESELMAKLIVLDTGVLGLVTNPNSNTGTQECKAWLRHHVVRNNVIVVPEIADYEVRRELLRAGKTEGLRRLDAFNLASLYEPIATVTIRLAAQLWADARARGKPTAGPESLDCDVILCAQALQLARQPRHAGDELIVATTNPRHLQQFLTALDWSGIE